MVRTDLIHQQNGRAQTKKQLVICKNNNAKKYWIVLQYQKYHMLQDEVKYFRGGKRNEESFIFQQIFLQIHVPVAC